MTLNARLAIDYYVGGVAHVLLKPVVILLGLVLRRNHQLSSSGEVTIVKLLGGGSLVIAYPALLAIKSRPGVNRLRLVASPATKPFADILGLFDEIIVIRDNPAGLAIDSLKAIVRLWRCETLIDLEIHSRLTTVFCTLTCARNRVGFYTANSFWRKGLSTHLLFCQVNEGVFKFYDQVARILGSTVGTLDEAGVVLRGKLLASASTFAPDAGFVTRPKIAIAPCCSDLSRERMLDIEEWVLALKTYCRTHPEPKLVHLLGGPDDKSYLDKLQAAVHVLLPESQIINQAGRLKLKDSVTLLTTIDTLIAIDSSMLHFARLLGVPTVSYWGPTDPARLLRLSVLATDEIHYGNLPCSPCVHISSQTPCRGNNLCIRVAVNPNVDVDRNPPWLA